METWMLTIISVGVVSLISFIGIITFFVGSKLLSKILIFLVAFAVGAIFGDAFLHIIPEIYGGAHEVAHEATPEVANAHSHGDTVLPSMLILAGILLFFSIEKFLRWRHCHHLPNHENHAHPVATMNLIGDGVHNFLDGVLIAGSYIASPSIGIATTIAVILHEIPQEIGDFATLLHAGYTRRKALFYNFIFACTAIIGAALVLIIGPSIEVTETVLLPLTAGGFIYIAGSDLIPMLHEKNSPLVSILQILSIALGIAVMSAVLLLE